MSEPARSTDVASDLIEAAVEAACRANIHPQTDPSDIERRKMRSSIEAALPHLARISRAPITEAVAPSRRDIANAINLARYGGFPGGLPPRDIEFEVAEAREYAYRLADAALSLFAHPRPQGEAEPTLQQAMERAYGILWRDHSPSEKAIDARKELLAALPKEARQRGIVYAIERYGPTTEKEVLEAGI